MAEISIFFAHIEEAAQQTGLSLSEVCARAKSFGFDAVEMDAARLFADGETLLQAARGAGLRVNCINTFFDFGRGGDDDAAIDRALALCKPAGCEKLLAIPGFLSGAEKDRGGAAFAARRESLAAPLQRLCQKAAVQGITVLMEDFDADIASFYNAEELLWFLEHTEGLRCAFDTGNFLYAEEDAAEVLDRFLPYIGLVHCKDRALMPNDGEVKRTVAGRALYPAAVGDGDLPIAEIVQRVLRSGYAGTFAAEHYGSKHQLRDMERSASFLRAQIGK